MIPPRERNAVVKIGHDYAEWYMNGVRGDTGIVTGFGAHIGI
jgi:hypothetical protein